MQHGYGGGVSEFQQFMVDASSLFSISSSGNAPPAGTPLAAAGAQLSQAVPQSSLHHPHFAHFHAPIPFTQQLFQQHHHHTQSHHSHHHFQLFNQSVTQSQQEQHERARLLVHQQLGLDPESGPENSGGTGGGTGPAQSFLSAAMGFKLAVDGGTGTGTGGGDEDDVMLSGGTGCGEEESAIKEPSWRPLDIDYISSNNNKRCKDKEQETAPSSPPPPPSKYFKKSPDRNNNNNYKLYSELEAIYKPGSSTGFTDCTNTGTGVNNQTGSGSALTGDENPVITEPVGMGDMSMDPTETSAGEEATPARKASKSGGEGRRKRRRQRRLSSLASFFERLVRQLVDHQEALHNRFLESMERREKERASREEAWRLQEAAKASREAAVRAQERALATAREAAIVSFLEKITGETINLPSNADIPGIAADGGNNDNTLQLVNVDMSENINHDNSVSFGQFNSSRWPKTEVQALIRVRSGLESRFQEPGLKGPLWEEVSMRMAGLGYRRSAKRCKEKWENINKYFRKAKESGKKRPQHSKTCPYFHQLDQLYSKSSNNNNCMIYSPEEREGGEVAKGGGSELLDAVVVPLDQNQMGCEKFEERESEEEEEEEEGEEEEEEREEEREGEGESHGQEMVQNRRNDSGLFF
ncbi:hypothetical protein LUZ60_007377 [Juncus effusus]|nr:hypothetical protein LUZ60_007377 [Juncus effusus]